jgi:hypothetical protein
VRAIRCEHYAIADNDPEAATLVRQPKLKAQPIVAP